MERSTIRSAVAFVMTINCVFITTTIKGAETDLRTSLDALKDHLNGTTPLSGSQIESHKFTIDANKQFFGDSSTTIQKSFDLITTYDSVHGPMWANGSTVSGTFYRNSVTNDIHWTMFNVMQYVMDDTYNSNNVATQQGLLNGYKFGSADVFPGQVTPPANPNVTYTRTIDGSFPDTYGRDTMHWSDRPARKPTGTYLAPGSIATITIPASLVNQGYQVRVGGNSWDFSNKNPIDRLDRVSLLYDIDSTEIEVASPLGGGIYIEVPFEADAGVVDVQIKNVVEAPFYSAKSFHQTTLSEWQNVERNHQAPWADFQTEKFMMHVPTSWINNLNDPATLMANWDLAVDIQNDLMGFDRDRGKETMFLGVDVRIRAGAYAPGYPSINATYNPKGTYNGNHGSHLIQGPQNAPSYEFHEMGHQYLFPKFPGETESAVNLLHVPVMQLGFGQDIEEAFRGSRGSNNSYQTLATTAVTWMTSFNFVNKVEMHQLEKQYQLKGHAKFVEIGRLFGWQVLGDFFREFNDEYEAGLPYSKNLQVDDGLLRLSKAVGVDITPLFHFYGVHPDDPAALKAAIAAEGLGESTEIRDLLLSYKASVPDDNAAFRQHALAWWGGQPSVNGYWTESEHAKQWDDTYDSIYDGATAFSIRRVIDELLAEYFTGFEFYEIGDLDLDGDMDGFDWVIFRDNMQRDLTSMDVEAAYLLGDLDHDFDNDIYDFDLFRDLYMQANPQPGAFEAMVAEFASIPEPGSFVMLLASVAAACGRRRGDVRQ